MLLLQRRIGESIYIGDDVKITVLETTNRQVRLGIQAPRDVAVHREEIYQRIQRESRESGGRPPSDYPATKNQSSSEDSENYGNSHDFRQSENKKPQIKHRSANPYRKNVTDFNRDK